METKYLGHITVNGKVYLFLKENRKINFFRVNERFFSRWLADGYSVYLSIDHDFFLYFVVNLSCISSSDSFLTQTTYTTGPSLQHWVLRFNNMNTRSLFVICCGSKNSSTLLFSRFQLIDSFHGDSSIKERDFTEVIILSWHRCLSFVCQCFFLFVSFELIVVGRWCTHNFVF